MHDIAGAWFNPSNELKHIREGKEGKNSARGGRLSSHAAPAAPRVRRSGPAPATAGSARVLCPDAGRRPARGGRRRREWRVDAPTPATADGPGRHPGPGPAARGSRRTGTRHTGSASGGGPRGRRGGGGARGGGRNGGARPRVARASGCYTERTLNRVGRIVGEKRTFSRQID